MNESWCWDVRRLGPDKLLYLNFRMACFHVFKMFAFDDDEIIAYWLLLWKWAKIKIFARPLKNFRNILEFLSHELLLPLGLLLRSSIRCISPCPHLPGSSLLPVYGSLGAQWLDLYLILDLVVLLKDIFLSECFHIMFLNFTLKMTTKSSLTYLVTENQSVAWNLSSLI